MHYIYGITVIFFKFKNYLAFSHVVFFIPTYNYSMIVITTQEYGHHYLEIKINVWSEHLKRKDKNTAL